jgi:hypothetical protein
MFGKAIAYLRDALSALLQASAGIGTWLMSLAGTLLAPSFPIFIEWLRKGKVADETFLITAVILAATFLFSAEYSVFRFLYIVLLAMAALLDAVGPTPAAIAVDHYAGTLLLGIALLHSIERLIWHVVLDRPFPDNLRAAAQ